MNVIYVANTRLPTEKAHGYQIMKMCEALASQGCAVELVVPRRKRLVAEGPFSYWGIRQSFSIIELSSPDLISKKYIPRFVAFWIDACFFSASAFFYVRKKKNMDVIYARDREVSVLSLF